ncbi:MAG: calcium-binding protein [Microcoleus sp.]
MANIDTKTGQLDGNDIIFAGSLGVTRADEYDLITSAIGQPVTLSLTDTGSTPLTALTPMKETKFNPFLEVINAETGNIIADSNDTETNTNFNSLIAPGQPADGPGFDNAFTPNSFAIAGGIKYKVRVTSYSNLDPSSTNPYSLQATIPTGDISLVPRGSDFSGSPLTGAPAVTLTGKLEGSKDFTFGKSLADEFLVTTSLDGQPLTINLSSTTPNFDPFVQFVNVKTGNVVSNNNSGGGNNEQLNNLPREANTNYRIRVTGFDDKGLPADYKLQVTVPLGTVTLTPRSGDTPIITPTPTPVTPTPTPVTPTPTPVTPTPTPVTPTPTPVTPTPTPVTPTPTPTPFPIPTPTPAPTPTPSPTPTPTAGGTPVTIAAPAINSSGPGTPTGQPANTVSGQSYNLSDNNDNILVSSLPPAAAGKPILGLSGNDNITGTSGFDIINGMQGADTIDGGAGNDSLTGGKGSDQIDGGAGNDNLSGNNDNDTLTGGDGNDTITGGKENDVLIGGLGDDILSGDRGQDILTGGAGNDTFILTGGAATAATLAEADVITDFTVGDKIGLTGGSVFASLTLETVSLNLNGGAAVSATAIKLGGYLGIVVGVAPSELTASVFVPAA